MANNKSFPYASQTTRTLSRETIREWTTVLWAMRGLAKWVRYAALRDANLLEGKADITSPRCWIILNAREAAVEMAAMITTQHDSWSLVREISKCEWLGECPSWRRRNLPHSEQVYAIQKMAIPALFVKSLWVSEAVYWGHLVTALSEKSAW